MQRQQHAATKADSSEGMHEALRTLAHRLCGWTVAEDEALIADLLQLESPGQATGLFKLKSTTRSLKATRNRRELLAGLFLVALGRSLLDRHRLPGAHAHAQPTTPGCGTARV